ncbi:MAG: hypothetical protein Q8R33_09505 [Burkholderiales bacterium]|nr:hypothetical protein [Burkholderiales bacterium]
MLKLILVAAMTFGGAAALASEPAPARSEPAKAADGPKAKFIKKCVRNMTKGSCTAPKEARAQEKKNG